MTNNKTFGRGLKFKVWEALRFSALRAYRRSRSFGKNCVTKLLGLLTGSVYGVVYFNAKVIFCPE